MTWNRKQRQYLEYVPASYDPNTPTPVIFCYHGVGKTMEYVFETSRFYRIADQHGWILITPQALDYNIPLGLTSYNMGSTWDAGVSATVGLTGWVHVVLNEGVDDAGLSLAILDDLISNYNIDQNNIFCTGVSMGGFMSNRMAIEHGDRIKAIASVNGTIGNELTSSTPGRHISTMHIHGTADDTITYAEAGFPLMGSHISLGLGAEATVDYWRNFNQCSETYEHIQYPNTMNDGKTFEQFIYRDGINHTKTAFIKTTNGHHEWYYSPNNDIDYATEIYNFFVSCMETLPTVTTSDITDVQTATAIGGGNVTSDGNADITARGVCWSTAQNPTLDDAHTTDGTGAGSFTSTLAGLSPNTTYYVRAYATNSEGTAYGEEVSFATPCDSVTITLTADTTEVCLGDSVTLTVLGDVAAYEWSTGDTGETITVSPASTTTYVVTGIHSNSCHVTAFLAITVHEIPEITLSGDTAICSGNSATLTVSGATTYLWSTTDTAATISVATAGTYTVTATNPHNCSATDSITVTVTTLPEIVISGEDTVTLGESTTLSVESDPEWTYLWNTEETTSSITVTPEEETTYSVTVTAGLCDASAFFTVFVRTIDTIPTDTIPTDTIPTDTIPTDTIPTDTIPTDTIPTDTTGITWYQTTIQVYPNPTNGIVNILLTPETSTMAIEIQVFDMYGKLIETYHGASLQQQTRRIDLSRYSPGVYIIKAVSGRNTVGIAKVLKK